jgi:hypothetical protein
MTHCHTCALITLTRTALLVAGAVTLRLLPLLT